MLKAYKYRIYPNKDQCILFAKTFGCVRFVYNKMLDDRIKKHFDSTIAIYPTPAQYKQEFEFLKEVDSLALANAQLNLDKAFKNFFKNKKSGFPKFKSKKRTKKSYTTNNQNGTIEIIDNKYLKLPKIKSLIKIKHHRKFTGKIKSCTISQTSSGKYFASILVDCVEDVKPKKLDKKIGIDLGLTDFVVTSNGGKIPNPKHLKNSEDKLIKLQRSLSRKQIGSKNRDKARIKVARMHEKITNQRKDFLHKLSSKIINENQVIVIEDLSIKNLVKNRRLSKAIGSVGWYAFRSMLEYKAAWQDRDIIIASRRFASSQLCSNCGFKNVEVKNLKVRIWQCLECNTTHDRDINAATNLLKLAI